MAPEATSAAAPDIPRAAMRGIFSLFLRQVVNFAAVLGGTVLLSRLLEPRDFGLYAMGLFVVNLFTVFGDAGLSAALVAQREGIDEDDVATVYTVQQVIVLIAYGLIYVAAPSIAAYYGASSEIVSILRVMSITLPFSVYRLIPAALMERELRFDRLAVIEVVEVVMFYGVTAIAAWYHQGPWSFVWGVLARAASSIVLATWQRPWRPRLCFATDRVRRLARFGVAFQGVAIVSFIKDSITPLAIGRLAGPAAIGLVNWASNCANYPLLFIKVYARVTFPTLARLQHDPALFTAALEKTIRYNNVLVLGPLVWMLILGPDVIRHVFTEKWMPALTCMNLFLLSNFMVPTCWPLMSALNARGRATVNLRYAVLWMVGTWAVGLPLIVHAGFTGYAMATLSLVPTHFLMIRESKQEFDFGVIRSISPVAGAAALSAAVVWGARAWHPPEGVAGLIAIVTAAGVIYLTALVALLRHELKDDLVAGWRSLRDRKAKATAS